MVCGQCHSRGRSADGKYAFPLGYQPGADLGELYTLDRQHPEGARNSQYNDLALGGGKHLGEGVVCIVCHDPHGRGAEDPPAQLKAKPNQLCRQGGCHDGELPEKQHPPAVLETVSCSMCHMPKGKHTFVSPGK
ncbi:MAG: hypothetical protein GTN78_01895 [Gemmatimonadales bacterium]|nr:hypothetical protein [Gemmatimonadales bacterium]